MYKIQCPHQALGSKTPEEKFTADQREVVISHDVIFDEDMALSKVNNLPTLRNSQEADTREPKEKDDESMPDVEEPWILLILLHMSLPLLGRGLHGLGAYLMMLKDTLHPEEPFVKVRNLIGIKDT